MTNQNQSKLPPEIQEIREAVAQELWEAGHGGGFITEQPEETQDLYSFNALSFMSRLSKHGVVIFIGGKYYNFDGTPAESEIKLPLIESLIREKPTKLKAVIGKALDGSSLNPIVQDNQDIVQEGS